VITVCRNSRDFIEQCIQSVLEQRFDDFEYVVIDGGSTDGTADIVSRYASRLAYWHSKPDRGLGHAFNLGVEHSRGRWLIFLNSDDLFVDDTALQRMGEPLARFEDADVVFGKIQLVTREQHPKLILTAGRSWKWEEFRRQDTIPHQAAFTNRGFFERVGPFSEEFRILPDYEHYLRAGRNLGAVFVPELIARMRTGGATRASRSRALKEASLAQRRHEVWSAAWMADVLYGLYVARGAVGRAALRVLGHQR
jgi:glycosyltransferase involved in cell wall biosynthesis